MYSAYKSKEYCVIVYYFFLYHYIYQGPVNKQRTVTTPPSPYPHKSMIHEIYYWLSKPQNMHF